MLQGTDTLLGPDPPESDYLEAYRQLRASLMALEHGDAFKSVLVTSATAGEGKSTLVLNLGTVLAFAAKQTVCVDLDLRHPHLHDLLGHPVEPGMTDLLKGEATVQETLIETGVEGLQVIPAGSHYHERADLLAAGAPAELIHEVGAERDFVIVDTTPVLDFAVPQELARVVDICLVVARARRSIAPVVQACEMLEEVGGHIAGIVVNDVLPEDRAPAQFVYYDEMAGS